MTADPAEIPPYATPATLAALRQSYFQANLENIFPQDQKRNGEWVETVGVAYVRRIYGYSLDTTEAQDEAVVAQLNAGSNLHRYHLHNVNCADFVAQIVNIDYPGAVGPARLVDFYLLSPKQVARTMQRFGQAHPELHPAIFEVEQLPGSFRRSRPTRFFAEALLKQKRYVFTLALIQPEAVVALFGIYKANGHFMVGTGAHIEPPASFFPPAVAVTLPSSSESAQSSKD